MGAIKITEKKQATAIMLEMIDDVSFDTFDFGLPKPSESGASVSPYPHFPIICKHIELKGIKYEIEDGALKSALKYLESHKLVKINKENSTGQILADGLFEVRDKIDYFKSRGISLDSISNKSTNTTKKNAVIKLKFDKENSILFFQGKEIPISKGKNSKQHYLLETIFKNKKRTWNYMDIADEQGGDDYNKDNWRKFWHACNAINIKIARKTQIEDFLNATSKAVGIRKKYLSL